MATETVIEAEGWALRAARRVVETYGQAGSDQARYYEKNPSERERHARLIARCVVAERIAARVLSHDIPYRDCDRADGAAACPDCGLEFREHPADARKEYLTVLCDGRRVKL